MTLPPFPWRASKFSTSGKKRMPTSAHQCYFTEDEKTGFTSRLLTVKSQIILRKNTKKSVKQISVLIRLWLKYFTALQLLQYSIYFEPQRQG